MKLLLLTHKLFSSMNLSSRLLLQLFLRPAKSYHAVIRRFSVPVFAAASFLLARNKRKLSELLPQICCSKKYLLFPYGSPDCIYLYRAIASYIRSEGARADISWMRLYWSDISRFVQPSDSSTDCTILDLHSALYPIFQANQLTPLIYPVIDTLVRGLDVSCLTQPISIDTTGLVAEIIAIKNSINQLAVEYDVCFIPDSAYLIHSLLKYQFLAAGHQIYWLNPMGFLHEYHGINHSEFGFATSFEYEHLDQSMIDNYISKRFSGQAVTDIDTRRVFNEVGLCSLPEKKCLLLHAFRDANNLYWTDNQPFSSFIEWFDFTLGEIRFSRDMENWYIRPHPSAELYENDHDILNYYLQKHGFPSFDRYKGPTLPQILDRQMPIYTCTGTVILETPSYGFKAFFCGPRFPSILGTYATSKSEWSSYLNLDLEDARQLSFIGDENTRSLSERSLYHAYGLRPLASICPNQAIMPRASGTDYLCTSLSFLSNVIRSFH